MPVINKHRPDENPPRRRDLRGTLRVQGRWVAVALDPEPTHEGLIVIPENAQNQVKASRGRVIGIGAEAAQALRHEGCPNRVVIDWFKAPGGVALDDGVPFQINGEAVRFVDVDQVLAVEV